MSEALTLRSLAFPFLHQSKSIEINCAFLTNPEEKDFNACAIMLQDSCFSFQFHLDLWFSRNERKNDNFSFINALRIFFVFSHSGKTTHKKFV